MNDNIDKLMNKLLKEIEDILYAEDRMSKSEKTDRIISVLEEEYDF